MTGFIHLNDLSVQRGDRRIIGPITVDISHNGITAIMGPNGAGKSTLLRAIHGLDPTCTGTIDVGIPTSQQGFVFQTPHLLRRSVHANLTYPLRLRGIDATTAKARTEQIAQRLGLHHKLTQSAMSLSGGEAQKLALGRALIGRARLLLVDEPCANLDPTASHQVEQLLRGARSDGIGILITTHSQDQAKRLADQVIMLHQGQIIEHAPCKDFFAAPQTPAARAYLRGDLLL